MTTWSVKLWRYEDFVYVEVWSQVVVEVAAVEDEEVDHKYSNRRGFLGREPQEY